MTEVGYPLSPVFAGIHPSVEPFSLDGHQWTVTDKLQKDNLETISCSISHSLENVLHHLSSDDSYQRSKGWNSGSPSSSESAESFRSSSFQSPRVIDPTPGSALQIKATGTEKLNFSFTSSLLPSYVQLEDYVDFDGPEVLFQSSVTRETGNFAPQPSADQSEDESLAQTSVQVSAAYNQLQTPSFTVFQEEDKSANLSNSLNRFKSKRPHTLRFRKWTGSPTLSEQPLSFTSCSSRLEEQLASVDHAWFGALDMPNFNVDEVDLLLSPANRLQSPNFENVGELCCDSKIVHNREGSTDKTQDFVSPESDLQNTSVYGCESTQPRTPNPAELSSLDHNDTLGKFKDAVEKAVNSDDTLTCSEAEYYLSLHKKTTRKYRKQNRSHYTPSSLVSSSDSESELAEHRYRERRRHRPGDYQLTGDLKPACCPSNRRLQNAQADAELKPWWPKNVPLLYKYEQCSDETETIFHADYLAVASPVGCSKDTDPKSECEQGSDIAAAESHLGKKARKQPLSKSDDFKNITMAKCPYETRSRRRRRQMELWQFILCRLQTARQSAFQWVNPSTGVFRIMDTFAGAREWGRYRNNNRMDYEKMARAMRFYYKDSILRKARQQLHFQFAMPYVEWATQYYQCRHSK